MLSLVFQRNNFLKAATHDSRYAYDPLAYSVIGALGNESMELFVEVFALRLGYQYSLEKGSG